MIVTAFIYLMLNFWRLSYVLGALSMYKLLRRSEPRNLWKFRIVSSNRLYESSQIRSGDTKDKRPVLVGVQIAISQNKETLVRLRCQLVPHDDIEQMLRVELLAFSV